jgi:hypothetical protein
MSTEALEERPPESVTVKVRVCVPVAAGAVHEVEAAEASEKEPAVEDQAKVRASSGWRPWAVACREMEPPPGTEVEEATRESMTGGSFKEA